MGKFERGEAEKLEIDLVKRLNNESVTQPHPCLDKLYDAITKSYPNIKEAQFIGRKYDEPGDVKLTLGNGDRVYIELKLVESGKGTRANISQDALTELKLTFNPQGETISWSKFRRQYGFEDKVLEELDKFQWYPPSIRSGTIREQIEKKARYLRDILKPPPGSPIEVVVQGKLRSSNPQERLAATIVQNILDLARQDKLDYISYLSTLNQDSDRIRRFIILLLLGFHKMNILKRGMSYFDQLMKALMEGNYVYKTYYVRKGTCYVREEDLSCLIPTLLRTDFMIEFPKDQTNVIISYRDPESNQYKPVLRVVFHWKNVFQGIKTPCLNVFDEGILEGYVSCPHP